MTQPDSTGGRLDTAEAFEALLARVRLLLRQRGRLSYAGLRSRFGIDAQDMDAIRDELVEAERVARDEDRTVLVWIAAAGTAPPPFGYTPRHLAERILASRTAMEGEKKQVTILFCDIVDSMHLAERVGAETWHRLLDEFFRVIALAVHGQDGTINQYTGDGVMALFGAPLALEDHAVCACRAALDLQLALAQFGAAVQRKHGVGLATRLGLNSGEVVVGRIGDDLRMDYTAQGQAVGLAQRMESLAPPNGCYLTGTTAALVQDLIELEDCGEFPVKGVAAPVRAYRLIGEAQARNRFDVACARGLTRFVGRAREMAQLEAALEHAQAGQGQVVRVVAGAGTGKTRLCHEFLQICRSRGYKILEARAPAHGRKLPFLPVLQIKRAYYGISEDDDPAAARDKIAGRLLQLDERFRSDLPLVFDFLGVPDPHNPPPRLDPDARQSRLLELMERVAAGADPNVGRYITYLEDLHWLDQGSAAFLARWVKAAAGRPLLVLVNHRPEFQADWTGLPHVQELVLDPLDVEPLGALIDELLGHDPSLRELAAEIRARSGGNPFFVEEIVQSLVGSGQLQGSRGGYRLKNPIDQVQVPATVLAVLAARIDGLPDNLKELLETAAAIGAEFHFDLLRAVCGLDEPALRAALRDLAARELILSRAKPDELAFKHPLTQEVAYGTLLAERRQRVHARTAEAIERLWPSRRDEHAALLAHHYEAAGQALEAARWHLRAAMRAGSNDVAVAVQHLSQVRTLLRGREDAEAAELGAVAGQHLVALGWRTGLPPQAVGELLAETGHWVARSGDPLAQAAFQTSIIGLRFLGGELVDLDAAESESVALAERTGDPADVAAARAWMTYPMFMHGRFADAMARARPVIETEGFHSALGERIVPAAFPAFVAMTAAAVAYWSESIARGIELSQLALRLARNSGNAEVECFACVGMGMYPPLFGAPIDPDYPVLRQARALAERSHSPFSMYWVQTAIGGVLTQLRQPQAATEVLRTALRIADDYGIGKDAMSFPLLFLADAQLTAGDADGARRSAEAAIGHTRQLGVCLLEMPAMLTLVRVGLTVGEPAAAIEPQLRAAEQLVAATGAVAMQPVLGLLRARLAIAAGDRDAARTQLHAAAAAYQRIGAARGVDIARRRLADLG